MPQNIARVLDSLERLAGDPSVSTDHAHFQARLVTAQHEAEEALVALYPKSLAPLPTGPFPLLRASQILVDRAIVGRLVERVVAAAGEFSPKDDDLTRISAAAGHEPEFVEQVVRTCIGQPSEGKLKSLAATAGVRPYALLMAGRILAAPAAAAARRCLLATDVPAQASPDSPGRCPVCDSPPAFASLEAAEGRRILHCSVCRKTWPFPRLLCPACRNSDQSHLAMITVDENASRWIELCQVCHRYVKTVDQRRLADTGSLSPAVEEVASLFLDLIAEDEKLVRTAL